ncbi:hypothetical protein [Microbacterium sp. CIAB417]|uniref:hypothetical protein n=1 Tax=Microbacterium sp. CIAB417 TaxID=2860287 RepID=UPI001FACC165|nr:hypothetical protein [Microbacterium sp. CIAB417]
MTSRQLRLKRAAAASSTATVLAAVSHTIGGGMPPHPLLVAAVSVLLIPLAAALIGRGPSAVRTVLTVLVSQAVFHVLFQVLGGTLTDRAAPSVGHEHHLVVLGPVVAAAAPDAPMLVSHLLAAIGTALLIWHGERILRGIARWARARLLRTLPTPPVLARVRPAPIAPVLAGTLTPLSETVSRRGPPRF